MSTATLPSGTAPPNGQGGDFQTQDNQESTNLESTNQETNTENTENSNASTSQSRTILTDKHGDIMLSIGAGNPSTEDILQQLTQALADASNGSSININIDGSTKKRKYTRQLPEDINVAVKHRIKGCEFQSRIAFLQTFREDVVESLVEFNTKDIEGEQKALLQKHLHNRITGNMASWRNRSIDKMITFVEELLRRKRVMTRVTEAKVIQSELKQEYSHELFVEIFDFCHNWLDIKASTPDIHKWCRMIFIELAYCTKKHVDWTKKGVNRPVGDETTPTKEWLINKWKTATQRREWQPFKPDMTGVAQVYRTKRTARKRVRKTYAHVDEDPEVYVPGESDDDDDEFSAAA